MNIFEFANPAGWWWALLAIPIVLLYILKIRMRRQPVPTLLFWDRLFRETKPRSWWQRLRHWLSLLLQLLFLLLLVAALVDPLWSWQKRRQRQMVLVVDNSASMRAIEDGDQTRLDAAKAAARAIVRSMRSGDQMAILSAGGRARVAMGMTGHRRSLLGAIDALPATDGPTEVPAAVEVGGRLLVGDDQPAEILVLSDGCFEGLDQLRSDPRVTVYGVGRARENVGITRYQVRRNVADAVAYQVLIDVTNFSDAERQCRVELTLDDQLVDVIPLTLNPGATQTRIVNHTSVRGGQMAATLNVADALSADNRAVAVLPQQTPVRIVLVTEGNVFLQGVLESLPLVELTVAPTLPAQLPRGAILVLDRMVPERLPRSRIIAINPQGNCDLWRMGEPIAEPIVAAVDAESPLTQHVRLDSVLFPEARLLGFIADFEPLIRDPLDQALLAHVRRADGGDVVVLTGSLEKGDLPLRIAFPVLVKNIVEWFQRDTGQLRPALSSGSLVSLAKPSSSAAEAPVQALAPQTSGTDDDAAQAVAVVEQAGSAVDYVLVSPSQQTVPVSLSDEPSLLGPLLETGIWTVRPATEVDRDGVPVSSADHAAAPAQTATQGTIRLACNLANAAESNLRPRAELPQFASMPRLSLGGNSLWFYLTLCATLLMAVEWWLYQRRIVG